MKQLRLIEVAQQILLPTCDDELFEFRYFSANSLHFENVELLRGRLELKLIQLGLHLFKRLLLYLFLSWRESFSNIGRLQEFMCFKFRIVVLEWVFDLDVQYRDSLHIQNFSNKRRLLALENIVFSVHQSNQIGSQLDLGDDYLIVLDVGTLVSEDSTDFRRAVLLVL